MYGNVIITRASSVVQHKHNPTHFIKRSHGGLGVPQNIVTLCNRCHLQFDSSKDSMHIRAMIRDYLRNKYVGWQEHELRYVK